jgi:hypothetical protein
MIPKEYFDKLVEIQKPLRNQEKIVFKVAAVHGTNSWQYRQEFAKECQIVQANYIKEVALFWQMMTGLYLDLITVQGKKATLEQVIVKGKGATLEDKPGWREVYKAVESYDL